MEEYTPVKGFPDYGVSQDGLVLNYRTNEFVTPRRNQHGYVFVSIRETPSSRRINKSLAIIVATAYVRQNPSRYDDHRLINDTPIHLDHNYENCKASNLAWRPRWFAYRYQRQADQHAYDRIPWRVLEVESGQVFNSLPELARTRGLLMWEIYDRIDSDLSPFPSPYTYAWIR